MATLSVLTIARNEEQNIAECLASVKWASELIVIDSGSTDRTVELARQFTNQVYSAEWRGFGATKNFGLEKARGEWVLWLDADERVTEELAMEIQVILSRNDPDVTAYSVARRAFFLGRWIRHCGWYPSRVIRLFRKTDARFTENRVHEQIVVKGRVMELQNDLLHYTDPDLHHYFSKFNRYTTLAAQDLHAAGKRVSLADLILRPPFMFFKMFVLRRGFLDGVEGFVLCILSSAYVFTKYAKVWELQRKDRDS